jgi:hypothetical protein
MLSSLPLAQAAQSLVDDTIKVALIGCGGRGTGAAVQASAGAAGRHGGCLSSSD